MVSGNLIFMKNMNNDIFNRQYQEESETEGKLFFRMRVVDSITFYSQNRQKFKDIYCEIEISGKNIKLYDQLKENERVRFYFLKGMPKYTNDFKLYDHETQKLSIQYLYLQMTNQSLFQIVPNTGAFKTEAVAFKEFVKENYKNSFLISSVNFKNPEVISCYKKDIQKYRNEIDVMGIVIDPSPHKVYGCLSNGHIFQIRVSHCYFLFIKSSRFIQILSLRTSRTWIRSIQYSFSVI